MKVRTGLNSLETDKKGSKQLVPPLQLSHSPVRAGQRSSRSTAGSLSISEFGQFNALQTTREQLRESFVLKERKVVLPRVLRGDHQIRFAPSSKCMTSRRSMPLELTFINRRPVPTNLLLDKLVK